MKQIPSMPNYLATEDGHIYSVCSKRLLAEEVGRYARVRHKGVHVLVCEAFHGLCPPGMQCSHIDGNSLNNKPSNLCWEFPKDNTNRKRQHGTMNVRHKLTEEEVAEIRLLLSQKVRQTEIAKRFGITQAHVSNLKLESANEDLPAKGMTLTAKEYTIIGNLLDEGKLSQAKIGSFFGLTQSAIYRIKRKRDNANRITVG